MEKSNLDDGIGMNPSTLHPTGWKVVPVTCQDCGARTGTRSVHADCDEPQTVVCKACEWKRLFNGEPAEVR